MTDHYNQPLITERFKRMIFTPEKRLNLFQPEISKNKISESQTQLHTATTNTSTLASSPTSFRKSKTHKQSGWRISSISQCQPLIKDSTTMKAITPFKTERERKLMHSSSTLCSSSSSKSVQMHQFLFDKLATEPSTYATLSDIKDYISPKEYKKRRRYNINSDNVIKNIEYKNRNHSEMKLDTGRRTDRTETDTSLRLSTATSLISEMSLFKTRLKIPDSTLMYKYDASSISKPESQAETRSSGTRYMEAFVPKENLKIFHNPRVFRIRKDFAANYKLTLQKKAHEEQKNNEIPNDDIIKQNRDKLMVIIDDDSEPVRYSFISREVSLPEKSATSIKKNSNMEFKLKMAEIRHKMKLISTYNNIYLLNGKSIYEFDHIPKNQNVIIISQKHKLKDNSRFLMDDLIREFYEYGQNAQFSACIQRKVKQNLQEKKNISLNNTNEKAKDLINTLRSDSGLDISYLEKEVDLDQSIDFELIKKLVDEAESKDPINNENENINETKSFTDQIEESSNSQLLEMANLTGLKPTIIKDTNLYIFNDENQIQNINDDIDKDRKLDLEAKLAQYVESEIPLIENEKLDIYTRIEKYYKGLNKAKIIPEEFEESTSNSYAKLPDSLDEDPTQRQIKLEEISSNLEILLNRLDSPKKKKIHSLRLKKQAQTQKQAQSQKQAQPHNQHPKKQSHINNQNLEECTSPTSKPVDLLSEKFFNDETKSEKDILQKNFVSENKRIGITKKSYIRDLSKFNKDLFSKNIPHYLKSKKLSRQEIHCVYILYKALCEITSQRYNNYNPKNGIDFPSFQNGIYQMFLQSETIANRVFNTIDYDFSGFLNWEKFLNAMVIIRAKTLKDKIDLFIKIADTDGNGLLSKEEVHSLCKICLGKFLKDDDGGFLAELCDYFTKLIFESVNISIDSEIPLDCIKQAILSGNSESDLLSMFCGADIQINNHY